MLKFVNPESIAKPFSRYSQVVSAPENCRWAHISGQVGVARDGTMPEGFEAQARLAWANVLHGVRAAGMGLDDIVKVTIYITRRDDIAAYRAVRDEALQGRAPAATMVIVSGLAHPALLIEVEAIAARPMAPAKAARRRAAPKAKAKAKAKTKARGKAKAKAKTKAKTKNRSRAKARPKSKAKCRAKAKANRKARGR